MNARTRSLAALTGLVLLAPIAAGCADSGATDACMTEAAAQAADSTGEDASTFEGDYELMNMCDALNERYEGDEGRVLHAVECIRERADETTGPDSPFSWPDDITYSEVMSDPMVTGACV